MSLWEEIVIAVKETLVIVSTILAFVVPYGVYKINQKLHQYGDPPWKQKDHDNS